MSSLIIQVERSEDIRLLEQLATRLGLTYFRIDESEQRRIAKAALVENAGIVDKSQEIPEELIAQTIENLRSQRYEKKSNPGSH